MQIGVLCAATLLIGANLVTEREITFAGADGQRLVGTLTTPAGKGPFPALLLIPGSGPTNRDGNQPPAVMTDLLKQLAQLCTDHGVVTLRFDKRAVMHYAPDWPKTIDGLGKYFAFSKFVGDASAAFNTLQKEPEVDPKRVAILGHSEGGAIALSVAQHRQGDPGLAGLILASTAGRTMDVVLTEQITANLNRPVVPAELRQRLLDANKRIIESIKQSGTIPADVPTELSTLYPQYIATYFRELIAFNPVAALQSFKGPVLIVQGESDVQVNVDRDARLLLSKSDHKLTELAVIPGASHNLKAVSSPAETGFTGPVKPEALSAIAKWLKAHLGAS